MNQRKTDFLDYLKHLSTTTLVHQQNFINKWYDLFSMLDENQYNSIPMDDLTDAEYYVMNYSIPHVGSYNEYSANGRPLVTVEKSTQYAKQVHLTKKLNTVGSPF